MGDFLPKLMLAIALVLAPFYLAAAFRKDERRNDLVAQCEQKGYSHQECRDHYNRYKPLPEKAQ